MDLGGMDRIPTKLELSWKNLGRFAGGSLGLVVRLGVHVGVVWRHRSVSSQSFGEIQPHSLLHGPLITWTRLFHLLEMFLR